MSVMGADEFVRRLDAAVSVGDVEAVTLAVQHEIENAPGRLQLDERFRRMWRYYLAYCEAGFKTGRIDVLQAAIAKS